MAGNSSHQLRLRVAHFARRVPWLIRALQSVYQRTRPHYTLGVTGVIFNPHGQVLLVEHVLHPRHPWGLPGGWVDAREKPQDSLARELREEVQLIVRVDALLHMETLIEMHHIDFAYLCLADTHAVGKLSPELLGYGWFDLDALPDLDPFNRTAIANALKLRHDVQAMPHAG
ncbi:MAG: NUDIX hydrolase [Chloroflexota bacterium]|nr:NUDIX hydrolase [Chloroflexota bacterium]